MGTLFIISGPSGVGKSTIRNEVLKRHPNLWYSISMTTREKRDGEVDGKDYFFVSEKEFINNINQDNFFEYIEVYQGLYYGTPKDKVLEKLRSGVDVILEIDVDGAFLIKEQMKDAVMIFIAPLSVGVLKDRLIQRDTDDEEIIKERLQKAEYELSQKDQYDYVIINDDLSIAINKLSEIINKSRS